MFQDTDGSLKVSPAPLIEQRLALAASAEDRLIRLGFTDVDGWRAGQNVEGLLATLGGAQPAGFVHGDFKPGNVLVDGADFHVIDWWIAPCISWPLTDVAAFVGNLRLEGTPAAGRLEECFLDAYFGGRCPEVLRLAVNLLATTTALAFIVQQAERGWRRRCWCRTALRRVLAGGVGNDRMQRRSLALCLVDDA